MEGSEASDDALLAKAGLTAEHVIEHLSNSGKRRTDATLQSAVEQAIATLGDLRSQLPRRERANEQ